MTEPRPLLAFPEPQAGPIPPHTERPKRQPLTGPSPARQGQRLAPQFQTLQRALASESVELTETTTTSDPELVAVFDLAGSVDGFVRAAAKIQGLEFLSELVDDMAEPDDDFFYESDGEVTDRDVPETLYMVMSNAEAVGDIVRLFGLWQEDPKIKFERGLNSLKQVFSLLRAVRRWGPEDRVRETGLIEEWSEDVQVAGSQGMARVEIELWYREQEQARTRAQQQVADIVRQANGRVITSSVLPEIGYHAVLADIPFSEVQRVVDDGPEAINLLVAESVMLVSPSKPMMVSRPEPASESLRDIDESQPEGLPRVALLDGLPLANHISLYSRLVIDDPDDFAARYRADRQSHGTAMSSIIIHGDLGAPEEAIAAPLYVRPILEPHPAFGDVERTPPDKLLVDLIHRAFHRMLEGDGGGQPASPGVRIVQLAIGDPARMFVRRVSPLARLVDWLAHKYNLVVIVSGGNHPEATPSVTRTALSSNSEELFSETARSLHQQVRHRRLLSPAEAVNVITVGALHRDLTTTTFSSTVVDAVADGTPASYSPVGFGYRRSVKPDVMLPGGRQIFQNPAPGDTSTVDLIPAATPGVGPGIVVAAPGLSGELDAIAYTAGTSNAAAFATRSVNRILDVLEALSHGEGENPFPDPQYHPVLAKTLLVHAAGWDDLRDRLGSLLRLAPRDLRRGLTPLVGYGAVRQERVAAADRTRVVLVGASSISKDERHMFSFPLPPSLNASTEWRRLTITLGWLSPLNMRSQKYRMARLRYQPPRDALAVAPMEADHFAVEKGTVQHQVLEGEQAVAFARGDELQIEVDCRIDTGTLRSPVRYALAASLEVGPTVNIDVHGEVRSLIQQQVRQRLREQVPTSS